MTKKTGEIRLATSVTLSDLNNFLGGNDSTLNYDIPEEGHPDDVSEEGNPDLDYVPEEGNLDVMFGPIVDNQ